MQKIIYTTWKTAADFFSSSPFGGGLRLSSPSSSLSSLIHFAGTRRPPDLEPGPGLELPARGASRTIGLSCHPCRCADSPRKIRSRLIRRPRQETRALAEASSRYLGRRGPRDVCCRRRSPECKAQTQSQPCLPPCQATFRGTGAGSERADGRRQSITAIVTGQLSAYTPLLFLRNPQLSLRHVPFPPPSPAG